MSSGTLGRLGTWLKLAFSANLGLKTISLVVALGLVAYTRSQLEETQRTVPVGLVLRLPPESAKRELMTPMPANIHVTLVGTTRAIDQLIQTGVTPVELDLREGKKESVTFDDGMFSLPPDVEIKIIDPPSLTLDWEDIIVRTIPIQAARTGQPAKGYEVKGELAVEPDEIEVRGPESRVEVMQFARLAAFDVTGLTEGVYRRRIAIDEPPNRVKYIGPKSAMVTCTIAPRQTESKFQRRPVEVVGPSRGRADPSTVDVTVTGAPEVVAALRAEQIIPRADLSSAGIDLQKRPHGSATLRVRVELEDAEAKVQPPTVVVTW